MKLHHLKILAVLGCVAFLGACATSRSVVQIEQPDTIENPAEGTEVRILEVNDNRQFQIDPPSPDIPSLANDEIDNKSITSRAYARKRNTYGMALGDVLIPEGKTVADAIAKTVENGFQAAGYRVLTPEDPNYASAADVKVDISEFWSWFEPGFWQITIHNRSDITLTADNITQSGPIRIKEQYNENMQMALDSDWQKSAINALKQVREKITEQLLALSEK
ncbi:YajG family lipoprotein [Thalassospira sp. SM2505]|uniref:Flagellar biosynthesis protein n=1 Tax=Thalassospira profundimaris TaxID=502049 RepID=A0A367X2R4_9PROT|nr:YajG family lipoprotein [Thalassospira profundimaris]RCK47956.1 hypothetical protein TH30_05825 [Thalassospira profundimaris]